MEDLLGNLGSCYYDQCSEINNAQHENRLYKELAEKEESLMLAAQFGKTLLDEKEQLELQLDSLKKEYQNRIEILEQERYDMKLLMESVRNEYENKIYELNEDLRLITNEYKMLQNKTTTNQNEKQVYIELINELQETNQQLTDKLNASRGEIDTLTHKLQNYEMKFEDFDQKYSDNLKLLNNYKKELNLKIKKHQEVEYILMQMSNERDQTVCLKNDLDAKLAFYQNEKQNTDQIIFNQERQIIELQNLNEELSKRLKTVNFNSVQSKMKSFACDNCDDYEHFSENSQVDNQSFNDYMNLFKINYESNVNWQDECQISEQSNNTNETNDTHSQDEETSLNSKACSKLDNNKDITGYYSN